MIWARQVGNNDAEYQRVSDLYTILDHSIAAMKSITEGKFTSLIIFNDSLVRFTDASLYLDMYGPVQLSSTQTGTMMSDVNALISIEYQAVRRQCVDIMILESLFRYVKDELMIMQRRRPLDL